MGLKPHRGILKITDTKTTTNNYDNISWLPQEQFHQRFNYIPKTFRASAGGNWFCSMEGVWTTLMSSPVWVNMLRIKYCNRNQNVTSPGAVQLQRRCVPQRTTSSATKYVSTQQKRATWRIRRFGLYGDTFRAALRTNTKSELDTYCTVKVISHGPFTAVIAVCHADCLSSTCDSISAEHRILHGYMLNAEWENSEQGQINGAKNRCARFMQTIKWLPKFYQGPPFISRGLTALYS